MGATEATQVSSRKRRIQTHCKRGHLLFGDNVRCYNGKRQCVACDVVRKREKRERMIGSYKRPRRRPYTEIVLVKLNFDPPLVDPKWVPEEFKQAVQNRLDEVDAFVRTEAEVHNQMAAQAEGLP